MTAEEMRDIAERHASDEETGEADPADTHDDRGALLALLRELHPAPLLEALRP